MSVKPPFSFDLDFVPADDDYIEQPHGELPEFWINWPKCRVINPDDPGQNREGYLWAKSKKRVVLIIDPKPFQAAYDTVMAPVEHCHPV